MIGAAQEVESNADISLLISMSASTFDLSPACTSLPSEPLIDLNCQVEIVAMRRNTASSSYIDQIEPAIHSV
jgi:hypothetical protein